MRVLHLYQAFHPARGGIEDFLLDLARESNCTFGDEHVVLTAGRTGRSTVEMVDGVLVVRAATLGRWFTPLCPTWPRWIRRLKPDIVHVHVPCPMAELAVLSAGVSPRGLVVTLHNDYVRPRALIPLWRPVQSAALRRAGRIVVSTPDYAATSDALRAHAERVEIIPFGLRAKDYEPPNREDLESIRQRHAPPLVVFLGRLCYYKGLEVLAAASRQMSEAATILVIGDGPWARKLAPSATDERARCVIRLLGALEERDVVAHLHAADVFVLPSTRRSEAFGIAQLKAMACGLPVVTSDLPGVAWLNRDGETGLTTPTRDAKALARALDRLLADDHLRRRLGEGARHRAESLTLTRMCVEYRRVYSSLDM